MKERKIVSRKSYEEELNQVYNENYDEQQLVEMFIYMTVKTSIAEKLLGIRELHSKVRAGKVGSLIRKHDPVLFNTGYGDFKRKR